MRIAVIGLTPVVGAMVERLVERARGEHTFAIWAQEPADLDWVEDLGVEACNSHVSAARGAHLVFMAMGSVRDTRAALFGAGQAVAEVAAPQAVIVDFSDFGEDLGRELARYGKFYLAATLEGDETTVCEGHLRIELRGVYGAVEIAVPVLEHITPRIIHPEP